MADSTNISENKYIPVGVYLDAGLSPADQRLIAGYKKQWEEANRIGSGDGMAAAHAAAEAVRAGSSNPYSGGADGSEFIPLGKTAGSDTTPHDSGAGDYKGYVAQKLPAAQSMEAYINALYAAQEDLALGQLRSQYEQNVLELDSAAAKIPAEYTRARNSLAGDNEITKQAFREHAAARGLSSGTGAQATLSMDNALLGGFASVSASEAAALSKIELSRASLQTAYSSNITKAIAENNLEKASALYKELVRLDEAQYTRALAQANENYRAYQAALKV